MARKITVATRGELFRAIGERYRASARKEKLRILDEFVALTGYHRKHAIRVLKAEPRAAGIETRRPRLRLYDEAVRAAVIVLWEASDRFAASDGSRCCQFWYPRLSVTGIFNSTKSCVSTCSRPAPRPSIDCSRTLAQRLMVSVLGVLCQNPVAQTGR